LRTRGLQTVTRLPVHSYIHSMIPVHLLFTAILKLFLISTAGYLGVRLSILNNQTIQALSRFVIYITLPCLIIATLGRVLHPDIIRSMALCAAAALGLNLFGILLATTVRPLFIKSGKPGSGLFVSLSSIQNSGYLPIPLITAILPENLREQGLLFTFVYMIVMGIILWTLGVSLVSDRPASGVSETLRRIFNPPITAILLGFLFLIPFLKELFDAIPIVMNTLKLVGETTIPLVLIILGGSFAETKAGFSRGVNVIYPAAVMKMVVIPAAVVIFTRITSMNHVFAVVLILQAAMPAAMNHIVVARKYGGDTTMTSRALLVQYIASMATVPMFLYLGLT